MKKILVKDLAKKLDGHFQYQGENIIDSLECINWGAKNKTSYKNATKEIDSISFKGVGWEIYGWYDVSGFEYWMKTMQEKNYIQLTISFESDSVNELEIENIQSAIDGAIDEAYSIQEKYNFDPAE